MCAPRSKFRPANLLLICWMGLFGGFAGNGSLRAQPLGFEVSARALAGWFDGLSHWFRQDGDPEPPNSGTCIDPNGKPKPCDPSKTIVPAGGARVPERPSRQ